MIWIMILDDIRTLVRETELVFEMSVGLNNCMWLLAQEDWGWNVSNLKDTGKPFTVFYVILSEIQGQEAYTLQHFLWSDWMSSRFTSCTSLP